MTPILVISDSDLLLTGIQRLIKKADGYTIGQFTSRDEKEIIHHIKETAPRAVILDGSIWKICEPHLFQLLDTVTGMRLFVMQIDSNFIQIYEKRQISLEQTQDLTVFF